MEKQKRWQLYLIVAVLVLTLYNILPTIFYYSKPLHQPVDAAYAESVALSTMDRVNDLEQESKEWLYSFNRMLGVKPISIDLDSNNSGLIAISFKNEQDADLFRRFLPRAGQLIPFLPAQLELVSQAEATDSAKIYVQRNVDFILDPNETDQLFRFIPKRDADFKISKQYQELVSDRLMEITKAIVGPSQVAQQLAAIESLSSEEGNQVAMALARDIVEIEKTLGLQNPITKRYFSSFSQINSPKREDLITSFIEKLEQLNKKFKTEANTIEAEENSKKEQGIPEETEQKQQLLLLNDQVEILNQVLAILKQNSNEFKNGFTPLEKTKITQVLTDAQREGAYEVYLDGYNPFIRGLRVDLESGKIALLVYEDVQAIRSKEIKSEKEQIAKESVNRYLINAVALVASRSNESFKPSEETFVINLDTLPNSSGYLVMDLSYLAQRQAKQVLDQLLLSWSPTHPDLVRENYPVRSYADYKKEELEEQKLGLVVYAPATSELEIEGFNNGSIYVIAKGMDAIIKKHEKGLQASENSSLVEDFKELSSTLQQMGFIGYSGSVFDLPKEFSKDHIFEYNDYYGTLLQATREDFHVYGSKKFAVLDFSDIEQRLLTVNKIEDREQEDLLKWREAYQTAQVDLNATSKYTVPPPTKNPYWQNLKLSIAKYFRGDDRKILKWGLDLSGGKTVRIGLTDQNGRPVTEPADLNQAVNELYARINKMGVAERTIRIENSNIILDFPGSQNLSASELIKASAMYFHIVNEKFTSNHPALASAVNQFLQGIWNEAVVTNRKDITSSNEIAWQHLGGDSSLGANVAPRSEAAKLLYNHGLRLANPKNRTATSSYEDTLSTIAIFREGESQDWQTQVNPLIIVFHNYALEGSNLDNVTASYDSTQGNILTFGVKNSYENGNDLGSPRDNFYAWTSQFAEDKITGTPKEAYSRGKGWRMAVVLNGSIITSPTLNAALRDGGTISGRFSQREVNQLAADLKAGSLSFTPRILSEANVSPELGKEERSKGIFATLIALALVVVAMVGYYHFAGVIASCAVLLNILIMWGVLQNIGAVLTLPGLAGIVLTIGMAVDANVLVFERIREEFKLTNRIGSAIQAGYRKAFSAIIDSNVTTIIAALILIQFDSGPIKGFAVTLIIGILSSMFTALFMTRYFFAGWVKNPKNKELKMAQFLKETSYNFLAQAKPVIALSVLVLLLGTFFFVKERKTIFGMDFTGGYSLTLDVEEKPGENDYRLQATEAFLSAGASRTDFEVRELSRPDHLRIQFGTSMDEKGHPFYQMEEVSKENNYLYDYQKDPRLNWVVNTLQTHDITISTAALTKLQKNWSVMSGQFSDSMRNHALTGLAIALLAILIYITFRFEFKYAMSAVIGLAHDIAITLGILAFFNAIGFAVQIDLQVIGAIMTIVGYSLNDTIIVFDRIREDVRLMKKSSFKEVINHALNVTLSRTMMTSGTTLLVLLALVLLGGHSIFAFSLVMTIGVIVGTLSSLFIAPVVLLYLHNREIEQNKMAKIAGKKQTH